MMITTSWDDGHPLDLRLADLLDRYGLKGTFYVPRRNVEGRPVMSEADIRALAGRHEIGGHSLDHVPLTPLAPEECARQIAGSKAWLEDVTGAAVPGFCYVRGLHSPMVRQAVRDAGYSYGRTTDNFASTAGRDPYRMPTTLQFYPGPRHRYFFSLAYRGLTLPRAELVLAAVPRAPIADRLLALAEIVARRQGCLHVWGHSWEIEANGLWGALEETFARLRAAYPQALAATNAQAGKRS